MNANLATILIIAMLLVFLGWMLWAVLHAPDLTEQEDAAHKAWLEERRRKRQELLDDTEHGVGATSIKERE